MNNLDLFQEIFGMHKFTFNSAVV